MPVGFEPTIRELQSHALPLGYGTIFTDSDGNRTRVTAVKGRCLNRLTTEPDFNLTPRAGLEPATLRLTAECSTIELSRISTKDGSTQWENSLVRSERPSRSDLKWRELPAAYHILSGGIPSKLHTEIFPKLRSSLRPISNIQLNALLHLHL